jgi:hypothetical protein
MPAAGSVDASELEGLEGEEGAWEEALWKKFKLHFVMNLMHMKNVQKNFHQQLKILVTLK